LPAAILLVTAIKLDSGSWRGGWATLGILARATAARNHAALARKGARHSPDTARRALTALLSEWGTSAENIGPETRLLA
jgi:hypothetical protein